MHQRLVLLTGVSACALVLSAPAKAVTLPGLGHTISGENVDDTLTISAAGDHDVFGVTTDGTATAYAVVGSPDSGEILQIDFATGTPPGSGYLTMTASNAGSVTIEAIAHANNSAGAANAWSNIKIGFDQFGTGRAASALTFDNSGDFTVDAKAHATGTAAAASATVLFGVLQAAVQFTATDGLVSVALDNPGTIAVSAAAQAHGHATAFAGENILHAIDQNATALGGAAAVALINSGTIAVNGQAEAVALDSDGFAEADARLGGIAQTAVAQVTSLTTASSGHHSAFFNLPHGPVSVTLDNSGTLSVVGKAHADAGQAAIAFATQNDAVQFGTGSDVQIGLENSGHFIAAASATATAGKFADAFADAVGVGQIGQASESGTAITVTPSGNGHFHHFKGGLGSASATLTNSGSITVVANAHAVATGVPATSLSHPLGFATARAHGIGQNVAGTEAIASIVNEGSISVDANAAATGFIAAANEDVRGWTQIAQALATTQSFNSTASGGFSATGGLFFVGDAKIDFSNSGVVDVEAKASAKGESQADIRLNEVGGLQEARGLTADIGFENSGTFAVEASANAVANQISVVAIVSGDAQVAQGADSARVSIVNSGKVVVDAVAHGTGVSGTVAAAAFGFDQAPFSIGTATATMVNNGVINIVADAKAKATGVGNPLAAANALALAQDPLFGTLKAGLDNSGKIVALATASEMSEGPAYASAVARDYHVKAENVIGDAVNRGSMTAVAAGLISGTAGSAYASAVGISVTASAHSTSTSPAGAFSGSIVNSGKINVSAKMDAGDSGTVAANATGIRITSDRNDGTITNSGTIDVEAVSAHGGPANAHGVLVTTAPLGAMPDGDDVFTLTNDGGTIVARESTDGGDTWHRGMAIDVSEAPNTSVINLLGDGSIYGDVAVQKSDEINVASGKTWFDGIINPSLVFQGGVTGATLDSGLSGVGTLNIRDGGNLVLADPRITGASDMYDGPSYAVVDTLNVASDGTVTFDLEPGSGGAQLAGSYSQIYADTANLAGTLIADVTPANGLFADSYSWQNVIDANALTGKFGRCALDGAYAGSLLLDFSCGYDGNGNVDLALTRTAFNAVAGLNANALAVSTSLEDIYNVGVIGGARTMFGDLFLISEAAKYDIALNQLSGSVYANYLNSFASLGAHYDDLVDRSIDCGGVSIPGSLLECRTSSPIRLWGEADYQRRRADGDGEAGNSTARRFSGLFGADANVGDAAILGAEAGYVTNHLRDSQFGDSVDAKGEQAGLYAAYDTGRFFLKGLTTYSWFNADSTRHVDFTQLANGATFRGTPTAHPDASLWTVGLHGGGRLPVGASSVAMLYVDLDYARARLKGFTETGLDGADLTVESSDSSHTFLTAGVKWATKLGGIVPQLDLRYRYRFGSARSDFDALFNGGSDFTIESAALKKGSLLAGLSLGGKLGPVDVSIGYEGEFNGDVTSHSGTFKFVLPLGGHAAPLPPPSDPASPPPAPTERRR